ncbi:hypothetical protein CsSME_00006694 [Camellia sinensis var. sinensis]
MNTNKFTHKTNEVIAAAHELAMNGGHVQFMPLYLAMALISDHNVIFRQAIVNAIGSEEATNSAGKLDPIIGRDEEIQRVIRIPSSRTKNNPILIGEPGVGKTAVVEGLAQRIVRGDVPSNLVDVRLIALDMGALVTRPKYRGEVEEWFKAVLVTTQTRGLAP